MWLTSSSIGRKFVMAITGACLVLFVTFHVVMNAVCIAWPAAYNQICMFLGANWYALIASIGLAALFIIHIIYAVWLTLQNRKARGTDRYAVTSRPPQVEWSSKNMLVLGIVILAFLVVHLIQFWAKMQLQEVLGTTATIDGAAASPEFGTLFIQAAFSCVATPIIYIIGFVALWFHMTHGFWSMFHSVGWDNGIWLKRLKNIGCWWTTIVVGLFIAEAVVFTVLANQDYYYKNTTLQEQYAENLAEQGKAALEKAQGELVKAQKSGVDQMQYEAVYNETTKKLVKTLAPIATAAEKQCPDVQTQDLEQILGIYNQLKMQFPEEAPAAEVAVEEVVANPE